MKKDKPKFGTLKVRTEQVPSVLRNSRGGQTVFQLVPRLELTARDGSKLKSDYFESPGAAARGKPKFIEAMADVVRAEGYIVLKLECHECSHHLEVRCSTCPEYSYDE